VTWTCTFGNAAQRRRAAATLREIDGVHRGDRGRERDRDPADAAAQVEHARLGVVVRRQPAHDLLGGPVQQLRAAERVERHAGYLTVRHPTIEQRALVGQHVFPTLGLGA